MPALRPGRLAALSQSGSLIGTLLSGLTYQLGGLPLVLGTAAVMVALAALTSGRLSGQSDAALA